MRRVGQVRVLAGDTARTHSRVPKGKAVAALAVRHVGLLAFRRGWVISEQDGALLLPRLVGEVSLLPVLHDVGEGELQVHVHSLQLEVLRVEVHQSVQKHLIEQNSISR